MQDQALWLKELASCNAVGSDFLRILNRSCIYTLLVHVLITS